MFCDRFSFLLLVNFLFYLIAKFCHAILLFFISIFHVSIYPSLKEGNNRKDKLSLILFLSCHFLISFFLLTVFRFISFLSYLSSIFLRFSTATLSVFLSSLAFSFFAFFFCFFIWSFSLFSFVFSLFFFLSFCLLIAYLFPFKQTSFCLFYAFFFSSTFFFAFRKHWFN